MLYRTVKKTGDQISILGFGCMRLPQNRGRIDEQRATRQIRFAIDRGLNYVDTAMQYHMGASEPFLGRALSDGYRQRIQLSTKLPPALVKTRDDMDRLLDAQLDMLKTSHIDYYLLHGLNGETWLKMKRFGACKFMDRAKADGRIRYGGFSFHGDIDAFGDDRGRGLPAKKRPTPDPAGLLVFCLDSAARKHERPSQAKQRPGF